MQGTRNKKWIVRLSALLFCVATAQASVELGIDRLAANDYSLLAGKRVGLITNQTGINAAGTKTRVLLLAETNRLSRPDMFRRTSASKLDIFYKVCGGTFIRAQVQAGKSPRQIIASWRPNEEEFRRTRAQYLLY